MLCTQHETLFSREAQPIVTFEQPSRCSNKNSLEMLGFVVTLHLQGVCQHTGCVLGGLGEHFLKITRSSSLLTGLTAPEIILT